MKVVHLAIMINGFAVTHMCLRALVDIFTNALALLMEIIRRGTSTVFFPRFKSPLKDIETKIERERGREREIEK